ncbi:MAG: hypothetical protein K1X88_15770 [Nannocystaceae bacterium]|nr:hypothetical protein [Nannocystaceae bacterium]
MLARLLRLAPRLGLAPDPRAAAAAHARANRIIAARLALACARERIVDAERSADACTLVGVGALPLRRRRALELDAPDLDAPRPAVLDDALALWHALVPAIGCDAATTGRIASELDDGVQTLAAILFASSAAGGRRPWLPPEDPRRRDAEHFLVEGHPWHPMCRTRLGLDARARVRLAPELCAQAELAIVDAPASWLAVHGDFAARLEPHFGAAPPGHVRLPVLRAQLPRLARLPASLRAGLSLARHDTTARALAGLRTVALDCAPLHLKLALDVLTTSARRTVSPMSVANGPVLSSLLARLLATDPALAMAPALRLMSEPASAGLRVERAGDDARQLGVIVRDAQALADGNAIVCAALAERDLAGERFVARLLAGYGGRTRAAAMLRDYVAQLLPPLLRLWLAHGVALEPHLQNTLVRVEHGRPAGFVVRDLGGVRLYRRRCATAAALAPGSFVVTDDEHEARGKLVHALIHAHLAAVVAALDDDGLDEHEGWSIVAAAIDACLSRWAAEPPLRERCAAERAAWFAPRVRAKALLRMRLSDRSSEYDYVELDNPLAAARIVAHGDGAPGSPMQ